MAFNIMIDFALKPFIILKRIKYRRNAPLSKMPFQSGSLINYLKELTSACNRF